jgi:hypothetical protein
MLVFHAAIAMLALPFWPCHFGLTMLVLPCCPFHVGPALFILPCWPHQFFFGKKKNNPAVQLFLESFFSNGHSNQAISAMAMTMHIIGNPTD